MEENMWDSLWNRELGLVTFKNCLPKIKQKNQVTEKEIVQPQNMEELHRHLTME
jgi:hypothetical protein